MATFSFRPSTSPLPPRAFNRVSLSPSLSSLPLYSTRIPNKSLTLRTVSIVASSFDGFSASNHNSPSKKSVLSNLIQEIEPLDVSLIQKDVPPTTLDAMKRTISGMLGLLPSDQFQVLIEALWEPISKLLISSMMTGYTLRNAEYRLCLEKNLEIYDRNIGRQKPLDSRVGDETLLNENISSKKSEHKQPSSEGKTELSPDIPDVGKMTPEAQQYILDLQTRLGSYKKELREVKRKSAALQMQQFVGEKNELLDYLRSLLPEQVAELSEPTSLEVKETIHSVVHGLLATLSPRMHSKAPDSSDNTSAGTVNGIAGDSIDLVENTSIHFQPQISLTRDYLARLLFWCMLLGHYLRGLEYRVKLSELLSLPCGLESEGSSN
ncbi:uncharacterized protein LOC132064831 [Lycium ferocissimum]|uniref:uncharacterized protein LOC132064831 n=1 Tax=Lycium ferocissimum TaxID=112874 RepID=UPI00281644C2|nr:uncharacterized protein LOC132064831 [Lycium ferocissimum]